jgi:hypothetical protein
MMNAGANRRKTSGGVFTATLRESRARAHAIQVADEGIWRGGELRVAARNEAELQ